MDFEALGFPKVELTERQQTLVDKLREANTTNVKLINDMIQGIEHGFINDAKKICFNQADKFRSLPGVIEILVEYLFDENEQKPWSMKKRK